MVVFDRPPEQNEEMCRALKAHIIRQRQKKKQEQEADAEVERQRKERERQQKQDKMTLGETREQISQLEKRLQQLKEEKHQLFLQLKKVLNEDDNRKKQLTKENDVMDIYGYSGVTLGNPQLFLQQNIPVANRNLLYKVPPSHTLLPAGTLKRRRSPSPISYPQYGTYKPTTSQSTYQKVDDNRRGQEYVRAVLWNKPYGLGESSQYGPFYTTSTTISYSAAPTPSQTVYTYGGPQFQPSTGPSSAAPPPQSAEPPPTNQTPKHHYMAQQRPHIPSYLNVSVDTKPPFPEESFYPSDQIRPATHVPLHGGAIPIQQPPQGAKTGGITSGYPIRPPSSTPTATTPHSVYVSQTSSGSRLIYSQPVTTQPGLSSIRYTVPPMQRET